MPDLPDAFDGVEFDNAWVAAAPQREGSARQREAELAWARLDAERDRRERAAAKTARRRRRVGQSLFLACCLGAIALIVIRSGGGESAPSHGFARSLSGAEVRPTPQAGEGTRLTPEVTLTPDDGRYSFTATQHESDEPVTYDPCRIIDVAVAAAGAPPDWDAVVRGVLREISASTGRTFHLEPQLSHEPADPDRSPYQPDRYGDRWAPILIAWTDPGTDPMLTGDTIGVGGSTYIGTSVDSSYYVSGHAYLVAPQLLRQQASTDRALLTHAVLLHEFGHVVGLFHVDDPGQIMNPEVAALELGAGDRTGLAALGAAACAPPL